jgi:hypothetical protein
MAQIEDPANLARFTNPAYRLATLILIRAGLRVTDALSLSRDCVVTDADGAPYLRYDNHKMKRQALVPIDEQLHALIVEQQARVGDAPVLFPRPTKNPDGRAPIASPTYRLALYRWLTCCEVRDTHGQPVRMTPHQWRHTLGTRLINKDVPQEVVRRILDHYAGDLVKWIVLGSVLVESGEQSVEDLLAAELSFVGGVVALGLQGGAELDGGLEEGAGLADRFEVAVQPDRSGAVAVAEHAAVHLGAQPAHLGAFGVGGKFFRGVVERFDLLADGEVLVGDGAVGDAGVHHGHPHRAMSQQGGDRLERHAPVDGLGGQGVSELMRGDVADTGLSGHVGQGSVDPRGGDSSSPFDEQVGLAQPGGSMGDPVVEQVLSWGCSGMYRSVRSLPIGTCSQ